MTTHLESYFNRYPDVPREAILKTDILRLGVRTERQCETDWFGVTTTEFSLQGGVYELRRTALKANAPTPQTPYSIVSCEGAPTLHYDGVPIAPVTFVPEPGFARLRFPDGAPYSDYAMLSLNGHELFLLVYPHCQNWDYGEQCAFCDLGTKGVAHLPDPERVAEVVATAFLEPVQMPRRPLGYMLSGGAIRSEVAGQDEAGFFTRYVRAIKQRLGNRWPCSLAVRALDKEGLKRLYSSGVDVVSMNLEVWDERIFASVCPGKMRAIGYTEWVNRLLQAVDIFGEGNVHSTFVSGVEMAQPFGFGEVGAAVRHTAQGFRFLMKHGVIPKIAAWYIAPRSRLASCQPPPLDYYIEIMIQWYEIWREYVLPPPTGLGPMGPGRAVWPTSAFLELGS